MKPNDQKLDAKSTPAVWAMWGCVIVTLVVGVGAAVGRGLFRGDFAIRADPVRQQMFAALKVTDPFSAQRSAELDRFDGRFAENPRATLLHIVPGGIFLILVPLQFSSWLRRRHVRFHCWCGRLLIVSGLVSTLAGLYFGLVMPYGGPGEVSAIVVFGGLYVLALSRGFFAIRKGQVARHREWMIRAFAIAVGIGTVRVVAGILDIALTPAGLRPTSLFALSLWTGWTISLAAGEFWVRYTRGARLLAAPAGAA
jgi:uncharacterized membrane protein